MHRNRVTFCSASRRVRTPISAVIGSAAILAFTAPGLAVVKSWSLVAGGAWNNNAGWTPAGVPGPADDVHIGNLFSVENEWITLNVNATIASLSITDGMMLDSNGSRLVVNGHTLVSGYNSSGGFGYPSRFRVDQTPFVHDFILGSLSIEDEGWVELENGGTLRVNGLLDVSDGARIFGSGVIELGGNGPVAFRQDGSGIGAGVNGLTIVQQGTGLIDLDGTFAGDSLINVTAGTIDGSSNAWLSIYATAFTDAFDDEIWLGDGNVLTMNIADGWSVGPVGILRFWGGNGQNLQPARIAGANLDMHGLMLFSGANTWAQVNAPMSLRPTVQAIMGVNDRLELNGPVTLYGGTYTLDQGAVIDFDAPTIVRGGSFTTASGSVDDGSINFNASSSWEGAVTVDGVMRVNGSASVTGTTVIDALTFDFDGANGNTSWSIGNSLTIKTASLGTFDTNSFYGSVTSSGTFPGRLVVNLDDPSDQWTMAGEMTLGGVATIQATRLEGSRVRFTGDLNIQNRVQVTADTLFEGFSMLSFIDGSSRLRLSGESVMKPGMLVLGTGAVEVGAAGDLTLEDGVGLANAGLVNLGSLHIGAGAGEATVDRFENDPDATWVVEIGGHAPGVEHDRLVVTSGSAVLAGELDVRVIGVFDPAPGSVFTFLQAPGTVSGTFDNDPVSFVPGKVHLWSVGSNASSAWVTLETTVPCEGELTGDGLIDGADLGVLLASWGSCTGCLADLNGDGAVDGADLGILLAAWGACSY